MQLICSHAELRSVVSAAARVAATGHGIEFIRIEAEQNRLAVIGEGSAHRVKSLIEADVRGTGSVSLPSRSFDSLLSSISGDDVRLSQTSSTSVDLRCGDHQAQLRTVDAAHIGEWPSRSFVDIATLPAIEFRAAIQRTAFIATEEETVTLLSGGVLLDEHSSVLRLTGMDRTRLSVSTLPSAQYVAPFAALVVPSRSLVEVERLGDRPEDMTIARGGTELRFACTSWEVRSLTVAAGIPEFDSRIPRAFMTKAVLARSELLEALNVAAILSTDEPKSVRLQFQSKGNRCLVTTKGSQFGSQRSEIPATVLGEDAIAEVSVRILMDGVRITAKDVVELNVTEPPLQRCLVKTTERDDDVYVFAVVA